MFTAPNLLAYNAGGIHWFDPLPGLTTGVFVG
jgi:hypothetical protein